MCLARDGRLVPGMVVLSVCMLWSQMLHYHIQYKHDVIGIYVL